MKKKKAPKTMNELRFLMAEIIPEVYNKEIEPWQAKAIIGAASIATKITQVEYLQAQAAGVVKQIDIMNSDFTKPKNLTELAIKAPGNKQVENPPLTNNRIIE